MKYCGGCNVNYDEWSKSNKVSVFCKTCSKVRWKFYKDSRNWENSPAGKAYMVKYAKDLLEKCKKIVFDYYGWHCNCCNERLVSMLTIDHVNNNGYEDRRAKRSGVSMYQKIVKEGFPNSYQILCMNCNWSKRIMKGICEHKIL